MNKSIKKLLITGASLFMFAGIGAGFSAARPVHAGMAVPEYYHSTNRRNNVYFGIDKTQNGATHISYYLYGRMPKQMLKRGHIFGLYYGRQYNQEVNNLHSYIDHVIYRHGQRYLPDYVGYLTPHNKINYRGHKGYIEDVYINQRDVNLKRPIKNSIYKSYMLHSIKYQPIGRRSGRARTYKRYYRKPKIKRTKHSRRITRHRGRNYRRPYRLSRRHVARKARRRVRRRRAAHKKLSNQEIVQREQEIVDREVSDINQDREDNGVSPLTLSDPLGAIASKRSMQLEQDFSHYDSSTGQMYANEDAANLGDSHNQNGVEDWSNGENINEAYPNGSANQIADRMNDEFMNHDASSNWGHRANILNPNFQYLGVGVDYNPNVSAPFKLAEDFSSNQYY